MQRILVSHRKELILRSHLVEVTGGLQPVANVEASSPGTLCPTARKNPIISVVSPFGGFHRAVTVLIRGTGRGWERRKSEAHTHTCVEATWKGLLCRQWGSCGRMWSSSSASPHVAPICNHTAEKERNARTMTAATEPSPTPAICCSVREEPFT